LVQLKIDDYKESELLDRLMEFVKDGENKVALQIYSIQLFIQYIQKYPELKDELSKESKRLNYCVKQYSWMDSCDEFKTMKKLENRISYGYRLAKSFSFKVFFISLITLIIGRYSIKSIKWVKNTSS
jgi:hypothetical protein